MSKSKYIPDRFSGLESLSTQDLENLLRKNLMAEEDDADPDLTAAIMEVIAKREAQEIPPLDVNAAWEEFQQRLAPKAPAQPRKEESSVQTPTAPAPRRRRTVAIAAVVCVLMTLLVMPVAGSDSTNAPLYWTKGMFYFHAPYQRRDCPVVHTPTYQEAKRKIAAKTKLPVLPTWYPEGSQMLQLEESETPDVSVIALPFRLEKGDYSIYFSFYPSEAAMPESAYFKNPGPVDTYIVHNVTHYLMTNKDRNVAVWRAGTVEVCIQGLFSREDLIQMIDSIYWEENNL